MSHPHETAHEDDDQPSVASSNLNRVALDPHEPALPCELPMHSFYGLTVRQHFAAMALQGLLSRSAHSGYSGGAMPCNLSTANEAVFMADKLIQSLNEGVDK